jgi:hypothetical protein
MPNITAFSYEQQMLPDMGTAQVFPAPNPIMAPAAPPAAAPATGEKRIRCSKGCHATFLRRRDYRRHMQKHTTPRYKCPISDCDKPFYRADKLRDHVRQGHYGRSNLAGMDGMATSVLDDWIRQQDLGDGLVHFDEDEAFLEDLTRTPSLERTMFTSSVAPALLHQERAKSHAPWMALRRGVSGQEDMHREATPGRDLYTRLATSPGEEIIHNTVTGPSDSGPRTTVRSGPQHDLEQSSAEPPGASRDHHASAAIDPTEQHMAASVEGRDSGYGTMSNTGPNHSNREDDAGSVRTMLSDASHVFQPPKAREDLISAFVDDLRDELGLGTMDVAGRTRIIVQLSGLLKVFSLKLGHAVLSQEEQDAKNFIRQQRE